MFIFIYNSNEQCAIYNIVIMIKILILNKNAYIIIFGLFIPYYNKHELLYYVVIIILLYVCKIYIYIYGFLIKIHV